MNYLVNLNLNKNQLQNAVIHPLTSAPVTPVEGQIYYNSTDKFIYVYEGAAWKPAGVLYKQGSTTGAVITGLDDKGNVTTTEVKGLTLTGITPVGGGVVTEGMTMEQAIKALDEAVKNAVAGGGEVNQNAFSNVNTSQQSDVVTDVVGNVAPVNIAADAKTDTVTIASGNKWVQVKGDGATKTVTIGHKTSAATAGQYGTNVAVPKITVDEAGHITAVVDENIKFDEYTITKKGAPTAGAFATYELMKNGQKVGDAIDIPKDYLVKSAELKTAGDADPSGFPAGTEYIDFVINAKDGAGDESHIYLNVESLAVVYSAGNGIEISPDNKISAKVVAENGLSVDAAGIKMAVAVADSGPGVADGKAGAITGTEKAKLAGIEDGATNNTITLNGQINENPTFFAPADAGTVGQVLVSGGAGVAPSWQAAPETVHKHTAENGQIVAAGGAFEWKIDATTHGIKNNAMLIQVYEVATGNLVMVDTAVNNVTFEVTITINDVANANTLTAGTYRAVLLG